MARYAAGHREEAKARILTAAGRGFRRRGYGGIGVDGLAKEAEVTSGAFYGHFSSKEAAFKEVVISGIDDLEAGVRALQAQHGDQWVEAFVDFYLGHRRTCELGESCALQSLTPDVQRSDDEIKAVFETGISSVAGLVAQGLSGTPRGRQDKAWALLSILSGGVTLARAVADQAAANGIAAGVRSAALLIARS